MASHQNAAKRLKALLRRTHFPVARLKQLSGVSASGSAGTANCNPWDGLVGGDPWAALAVMHWTLLDMSPLFAAMLLDRQYGGLQSLTDYKFVSRCLRMLREEFSYRPPLTVEQFLTHGYAEVKMRLLADIVDIVMRTHHNIAQKDNSDVGSTAWSNGLMNATGYSGGGGSCGRSWGVLREGDGRSSPWSASASNSVGQSGTLDTRESASSAMNTIPPSPPQLRSPPLLNGRSFSNINDFGVGDLSGSNRHLSSSPSCMSDEQNVPPVERLSRTGPHSSQVMALQGSVHPTGTLLHEGHIDPRTSCYRDRTGVWMPGSGDGREDNVAARHTNRSPLGSRSYQGASHTAFEHMHNVDEGAVAASTGLLPPPLQCPSPGSGQPDWHAVHKAFGSPRGLQVSMPPPATVPVSPPTTSPMSKLSSRSASSGSAAAAVATAGALAADFGMSRASVVARSNLIGTIEASGQEAISRCVGGGSGESSDVKGGNVANVDTRRECRGRDSGEIDDISSAVSAALAQVQWQVEASLDQHSRALNERITSIEQMLSARLTLLETKVQGLDQRALVRT